MSLILRKGDELTIILDEVSRSSGGKAESTIRISYEDLTKALKLKQRKQTSKGRFGRVAMMYINAVDSGTWRTGSPIDPRDAVHRLYQEAVELDHDTRRSLNPKTVKALQEAERRHPELDFRSINSLLGK